MATVEEFEISLLTKTGLQSESNLKLSWRPKSLSDWRTADLCPTGAANFRHCFCNYEREAAIRCAIH
jgi:hypothetical protein